MKVTLKNIKWWTSKATAARLPKEMAVKIEVAKGEDPDLRRRRAVAEAERTTGFRIKDCRLGEATA